MNGDEPLQDLIRSYETMRETLKRLRAEAWDEGYRAGYDGKDRRNPYRTESIKE